MNKTIWTIGHSTRTLEDFLAMLLSFNIQLLADIRSFPGSKRYPHFNKEALKIALEQAGIQYAHLPELGGRRKPREDSTNTLWRSAAFRGYADYMETDTFKKAINQLENTARQCRTTYMCSEAVWWRCHRLLVSDYLKIRGWNVIHIMAVGKVMEHSLTAIAQTQGNLFNHTQK